MTNNNDDNDIDLGLALGCTTDHNNDEKNPNDDSGAGVNASTTVDMAFVAASDPLSELVWSPRKGLSLKCADNSVADKKPFLLWNVGPSNLIASSLPSQSSGFKGIHDENAVNENLIISQERYQTDAMGSRSGNEADAADGVNMLDANQVEENVKNTEKGFCITQDILITQTVESSENHAGQGDLVTKKSLLHGSSSKLDMETTEPRINLENVTNDKPRNGDVSGSSQALIPTAKESEAIACMLPNSSMEKEANKTLEFAVGEETLPAECIAENDMHLPGIKETCDNNEEKLSKDSSPTHSRSSSCRRKAKGKGKALTDGNVNSKMSNDDDEDSHESVESCNNSAGLIPTGKKRWHFEQQYFVGSKRIKKHHMHGDPATESTVAARSSSFMTWISNMVKSSFSNNEENQGKTTNQDIVMYDKDHDPGNRPVGFQTVFQSLYCPPLKLDETEVLKDDRSMGEELPSDDKILIKVPPISYHPGDNVSDAACIPMPNDRINQSSAENKASNDIEYLKAKDGLSSSFERDTAYDYKRQSYVRSLWITRFSNKNPGPVLNVDNPKPTAHETNVECRSERGSSEKRENAAGNQTNFDDSTGSKEIHDSNYEMSVNNLQLIMPSAKFKKSEALASLFARRLDALKHIVPSEYSYTRTTCFFCGRSGHDLRNCSEVTESELEILIRNVRSYDGAEESSCLCIRCFQLDHWAISCPASSSNMSQQLENFPSLLDIKQGYPVDSTDLMHNRKQFLLARTSGSNLVNKEIANVPKGIFDVIRGLRLSRVDVLKWMNSNTSLSHLDGFFLRLRLGKLEAGLGGTGYYIACISGLEGEKSERGPKNCISVNVCGVKCFVGSQYVSNQDFLEDELNVWWRKTLESGGNVPTEGDLRVKLEERMKLGF